MCACGKKSLKSIQKIIIKKKSHKIIKKTKKLL